MMLPLINGHASRNVTNSFMNAPSVSYGGYYYIGATQVISTNGSAKLVGIGVGCVQLGSGFWF